MSGSLQLAPRALPRLAVLVLALTCGSCGQEQTPMWRANFETLCGTVPCGWTQVAGPPGSVVALDTLPGVHGLTLVGDGVAAAASVDRATRVVPAPVSTLQAHVVGRCDAGATLSVVISVTPDSGGLPLDVTALPLRSTLQPSFDGTRVVFGVTTDSTANFEQLLGVIVRKDGPGACDIDYLSLASVAQPFVE